jgi:2-oxoisovalerate dehydrogenase E2 component (dihydrolipoyl transacylase)
MGHFSFRLPDVGEGVAEAELVALHVKPGDEVSEDESLAEIMTDKAALDISSPVSGKVLAVHGEVGGMIAVGAVLIEFEVTGIQDQAESVPADTAARPQASTTREPGDEPLVAPATRRRADALGIPLQHVSGTGPGGRITPEDLDNYIASGGQASAADPRYVTRTTQTETQIIGLRRKIAQRMEEAKRRIPHITYVEACDVTELEALRQVLNESRTPEQPKLSLLPFFLRALARVLPDFPQMNAHFDDDAGVLRAFGAVHVGIAAHTSAGLKVPVVRHAESRDIWNIAAEISRVSSAARDGSAAREELSGSTITLTSLGALGGIASTPVINRPEVAILAPNKIVEQPVLQGTFVTVRKMMNLSAAFDHRIVDGHDAASFVQRLKRMIEHPALIFVD